MTNTCFPHHYLLHGPQCACPLCGDRTFGRCMFCGHTRTWPRGWQGDADADQYRERAIAGRAEYNRKRAARR